MSTIKSNRNTTSKIIKSLLDKEHSISIFSKEAAYAIEATAVKLDIESGKMTLEIDYTGASLSPYLNYDTICFDIEALRRGQGTEEEIYNIEQVPAKVIKIDARTYHLECQLPNSIFSSDNRRALRVPFILGMQARAHLNVFAHELNMEGKVRNLSLGGCMVNVSLEDSITLTINQTLSDIALEFPNGEKFNAQGCIRHMRPFGSHGFAAIGIEFINMTAAVTERLFHYVSESESEAGLRSGIQSNTSRTKSRLFVAGVKEKKMQKTEDREQIKNTQRSPLLRGALEIAHQLKVILMFIKNRELFPEDSLYECVDSILYMVNKDRKALKYALPFLYAEPEWVRHAIQVGSQLAMVLISRDPHSPYTREALAGALLHTMGKPLLINEQLPSLKMHMSPSQTKILKGHAAALDNKLSTLGWIASPTCHDITLNANERLDGSGYPNGKTSAELSERAKLISIIKIINKLTHERNGQQARQPLEAYRWVNNSPNIYEKLILVEYIQHFGLYPIGSLAKFSGGFLAWIMDVDAKGIPCKVNIIKNLSFKDTTSDTILEKNDFDQIGQFVGTVNPTDYGINTIKNS